MNPLTIVFGYSATVRAPAKSFQTLCRTWTKSLQEHNSPYFWDEKHAVIAASSLLPIDNDAYEFRVVFGVEIDWHEWPDVAGFTVGRTSVTGMQNVQFDVDALPTGRKLLERSIKKAKKLKRHGPLKPVELAFDTKRPSAFVVNAASAPTQVILGILLDSPPAELPDGVTALALGSTFVVGFQLAQDPPGERMVELPIDPLEFTYDGKELDEWVSEVVAKLGNSATEDSCNIYAVSPLLPPGSLRLGSSLTNATAIPEPEFTFEPDAEATAHLLAGRCFDDVALSVAQGARLDTLLEQVAAASGLNLIWEVTGDGSVLQQQIETKDRTEAREVVIGRLLAVASSAGSPQRIPVGETLAALQDLNEQLPSTFWADVSSILCVPNPVCALPTQEALILFATGPLAAAYLAAGTLVDSDAESSSAERELIVGTTMEQTRQPRAVLGKRLAGFDHDDSLGSAESVPTATLQSHGDADIYLVASFD